MRAGKVFAAVLLLLIFFSGCKREEAPLAVEDILLNGNWSETFAYSGLNILFDTNPFQSSTIPDTVTSRISFRGGNYYITFSGSATRNKLIYRFEPIEGTYRVQDGFLCLTRANESTDERFSMKMNGNKIMLSIPEFRVDDSTMIISINASVWAYSLHKCSGEFKREE